MTKILSQKYSLNKEDYKRIIRNSLIMFSPTILLLLSQIESWNIDYNIIWTSIIWILIDTFRRYIRELTT